MGLFKRNKDKMIVLEKNVKALYAVVDGDVLPIEETPDPVFAQKMMGDGVVFIPDNGRICACMDATVTLIFPTKHAIGLRSENGIEVLIHIGLDTVELEGKPFKVCVKEGQKVKVGTLLMEVDLELIKKAGKSIYTPVVITNSDDKKCKYSYGKASSGESVYCDII